MTLHATAVAINGVAVLIRGNPGSGKSTLALELIDCPGKGLGEALMHASLIADDQTIVSEKSGQLWCSCPASLQRLLEVRGLGILAVKAAEPAPLALVVDLVPPQEAPRFPVEDERQTQLLGITVPRLALASGGGLAARLRAAMSRL